MNWHDEFIKLLQSNFEQRKFGDIDGQSLRSISNLIGLSPGTLSDLIAGKRKLSSKRAFEVLEKLSVSDCQIQSLKVLADEPVEKNYFAPDPGVLDDFDCMDAAICAFVEMNQRVDQKIFSAKLGITEDEINVRLERLFENSILERNEEGEYFRSKEDWRFRFADGNQALLRRYLFKGLELSQSAIEKLDVKSNVFLSQTFSANAEQLKYLKTELERLISTMSVMSESSQEKTHVFQFSVQAFKIDFSEV